MDIYSYPDSVISSPRSVGKAKATRGTVDSEYSAPPHHNQRCDKDQESFEESGIVRFMCSYGGRILPRPHDNQLRYVGGDTRIVAVARNVSYSLLILRLSKLVGSAITLKYRLPNEDLDALISVTTKEDLENMMEEYDRLQHYWTINIVKSSFSSRLRLFLFSERPESTSGSLGSLLEISKQERWFVDALNGVPLLTRGSSEVSSLDSENHDYLFGLDTMEDLLDPMEDWNFIVNQNQRQPLGKSRIFVQHGKELNPRSEEEVHSMPVSPKPDSSSCCPISSAHPCMDSHVAPVEPQQAGEIEMDIEGLEPLTSADHETPDALESSGHQTQDPGLVFDDHMTKITPAEAFQQVQIPKQEQDAIEGKSQSPMPSAVRPTGQPPGMPLQQLAPISPIMATPFSMLPTRPIPSAVRPTGQPPGMPLQQLAPISPIMAIPFCMTPTRPMPSAVRPTGQPPGMPLQQLTPIAPIMAIPFWMLPTHPMPYAVRPIGQPPGMPLQQLAPIAPIMAIPFCVLPTRSMPSTVRPTGQPPRMPLQQLGPIAPIMAPVVYSNDMHTSRSAVPPVATMQMTQKVVTSEGPSYPAKAASNVPLHGARPLVNDMRTMMGFNEHSVVVYYIQMDRVMMPQYQTMLPVTTDLQTSFQVVPKEPELARVGQSL